MQENHRKLITESLSHDAIHDQEMKIVKKNTENNTELFVIIGVLHSQKNLYKLLCFLLFSMVMMLMILIMC
jgi:hypothetical protein